MLVIRLYSLDLENENVAQRIIDGIDNFDEFDLNDILAEQEDGDNFSEIQPEDEVEDMRYKGA